jgi:hypothetical protein
MIDPDEKPAFAEMLTACCINYGRDADKGVMRLWWNLLSDYSFQDVAKAMTAHIRSSSKMPAINDILGLINAGNPAMQRPGADEAWAMMPRSEDDSVVWTDEMAYAWGIASSLVNPNLVDRPDWVAARMAFKDAYSRAVDTAKAQSRPVQWRLVLGHTKDNLLDVVTEAVRLGRMSDNDARPLLAELEYRKPLVAGLLEGTVGTDNHDKAKQELARIKSGLFQSAEPENLDAVRAECESRDRERKWSPREDAA